jgi:hypothetical protein
MQFDLQHSSSVIDIDPILITQQTSTTHHFQRIRHLVSMNSFRNASHRTDPVRVIACLRMLLQITRGARHDLKYTKMNHTARTFHSSHGHADFPRIWCRNTVKRKGNLRCKRAPSSGSRRYPHIRPTAEPIHTIPLARMWDKNAQMTFNPPNPPASNWASFLRGPGINVAVIASIGVQIVRYLRVLLQGPIRRTRRIAHQGIDLSVEPYFLLCSLGKLIQGSSRAELERFCPAQLQIDGFRRIFCSGGSGDLSPCWVSH